jgi:adenylosuccinate lyase
LGEIEISSVVLAADLSENWEVLAEAIQTVVRAEVAAGRSDITDPYQLLKDLTRGQKINSEDLSKFVQDLNIGQDAKDRLLMLKPNTYTGLASELVLLLSK